MFDSSTPLLQHGNSKLGRAIHVWSIPALDTCPGSTAVCRQLCYATRHRFRFDSVRRRLAWNRRQCDRPDFVERMVTELRSSGVLVLRLHVAGDFYDAEYVGKWTAIVKRSPRVRFYGYTRSWRVSSMTPALEELAALKAVRLWWSVDDEAASPRRSRQPFASPIFKLHRHRHLLPPTWCFVRRGCARSRNCRSSVITKHLPGGRSALPAVHVGAASAEHFSQASQVAPS